MSLPFSGMDLAAGMLLDDLFATLEDHEARQLHVLLNTSPAKNARDDSGDDWNLARLLALGTRKPPLIEYIMRGSERVRPKWDEKRGPQHTYLTYTIENALTKTAGAYEQRTQALEADDLPVLRSLAAFLRDPDAMRPPTPVIPRLAWSGRITLFASSEGWGKSTFARAGAAAVTTGQAFLDGVAAPPGTVLWARLEESEYDCMMAAHGFGADPDRFTVWTPGSATPIPELIALMRRRRPTLTVIDSIQELAILAGVEKLDDAGQMGRALLPLALAGRSDEVKTAMLWLSQGSKATGRYRNSSWLGHQADAVIEIQEPKAESTIRDLCVRKKRMDVFSYRVELADGRYQLGTGSRPVANGGPPKLSGERRKVLKALVAGMSYTMWLTVYGGNANTFKKEVRVLDRLGLVTQDVEHGTWAPVQFTVEQELAEGTDEV